MTLVGIFEYILDEHNIDSYKIKTIINKAESVVMAGIEKTLDKITF